MMPHLLAILASVVRTIVSFSGASVTHNGGGVEANVEVHFNSDASYETVEGAAVTDRGDWVIPTSQAGDYSVRLTVSSGDSPTAGSAAINSWLALTSDRDWILNTTSTEVLNGSWLIEIALTTDTSTVLDSATFSMTADNT